MSKSLGNFFTVRDLLDQGVPGEVIRFVMLSTHYRKPMDWTQKKREEAEKTLRRWRDMLADVEPGKPASEVIQYLRDDLNTAGAINFLQHMGQAVFQKSFRTSSERQKGATSSDWYADASEFVASAQLLGLLQANAGKWVETPDLHPLARYLADIRNIAMQTKDFSEVDRLKSALVDAGVEVRMSKEGVDLIPGPGFDPAKLEALK
jgi:cysteinyl-tRNA synthetase